MILEDKQEDKLLSYQKRWQKECPNHLTKQDCFKIWTLRYFTSSVTLKSLQTFKIMAFRYYTPKTLMYSQEKKQTHFIVLEKKCGEIGTYRHCWYNCPEVKIFWGQGVNILKPTLENIFSGPYTRQSNHHNSDKQYKFCSQQWKPERYKTAHSIELWFQKLWMHYIMAKTTGPRKQIENENYYSDFIPVWFSIMTYMAQSEEFHFELW